MKLLLGKAESSLAQGSPLDRAELRSHGPQPAPSRATSTTVLTVLARGLDRYAAYVPLSISARFWKALARAHRARSLADGEGLASETATTDAEGGRTP